MWNKEQVVALLQRKDVQLTSAVVISLGAGFLAGREVGAKQMKDLADQEIAEVKAVYSRRAEATLIEEEKPSLEVLVEPYISTENERPDPKYNNDIDSDPELDKVIDEAYEREERQEIAIQANVFDNMDPDAYFNYEEELKFRADFPDMPYILHKEEFLEADPGYEQVTLTYYEGDEVLTDEKDQPVDSVVKLIGDGPLDRFGHGSEDINVVFVRNDRLQLDFEIVRSSGKFSREVLGFEADALEHSDRRARKFKNWDD